MNEVEGVTEIIPVVGIIQPDDLAGRGHGFAEKLSDLRGVVVIDPELPEEAESLGVDTTVREWGLGRTTRRRSKIER